MQYLQTMDDENAEAIVIPDDEWQVINEFLGIGGLMWDEMLYDMVSVYVSAIKSGRCPEGVRLTPGVRGDV